MVGPAFRPVTPLQVNLYWRAWAAAKRTLTDSGRKPDDVMRHRIQARAVGRWKSSKKLTNPELDLVLAAFRAISQPADLDAQLALLDQGPTRVGALQQDCIRACMAFIEGNDPQHKRDNCLRYLDAIAQRLTGNPNFYSIEERDMQKVYGIVRRREKQVLRKLERERAEQLGEVEPF